MSNTIKIKRNSSGIPSNGSLEAGELAVNTANGNLWVGNTAGDAIIHLNSNIFAGLNVTSGTAEFGGGYGSTGASITTTGNIFTNGDLAVDGAASITGNLTTLGTLTATGTTINSAGNGELTVSRTSGAAVLTQAQSAAGRIGTTTNHDLQLMTNSTVYARLTNDGRFGIGCDPSVTVQINKASIGEYLRVGSGGNRELRFTSYNTSSANAGHQIDASSTNGELKLATAGTDRLTIGNTGTVTVSGATTLSGPFTLSASSGAANTPVAWLHNSGNTSEYDGTVISTVNDGSDVEVLHVRTNNTAYNNGTSLMLVRGDGRLGINTSAPDSLLNVFSSTQRQLSFYAGTSPSGNNYVAALKLGRGQASNSALEIKYDSEGSEHAYISRLYSNAVLHFDKSGTDHMTISAAGTVTVNNNLTVAGSCTFAALSGTTANFSSDLTASGLTTLTTNASGYALKIFENSGGEYFQLGVNQYGGLNFFNETVNAAEFYDTGEFVMHKSATVNDSDGRSTLTLIGAKTSDGNFADIYGSNNSDTGHAQISFRRDGANDAASILFYTEATGASMAEKMRLTSAGRLGLATAAPDEILHVAGNAKLVGDLIVGSSRLAGHSSGSTFGLQVMSGHSSVVGLEFKDSSNNWRGTFYGNAGYYGFLDSSWGNWDIQKQVDGPLKIDQGSGLETVLTSTLIGTNLTIQRSSG